jgi:pimeloyl-ACP methyl ester carboxylesterase
MISNTQRSTIDLSAGPIDYIDTAGDGPTVVLLHGVLMNHTVWQRDQPRRADRGI